MDRFEAMRVFCKVVEAGSFAAASEQLDISTSVTSRLVAQLEAHLQARLLNRTTRRISLTEEGRAYYERSLQLLADLEEAEEVVNSAARVLRGSLRITAPISLGAWHLAPAIAEFTQQHPQLRFDVVLSDHQMDLVEEGIDLAIRVGNLGSQNLVARPIGQARMMTCAAPAYLAVHGTPETPADLRQHACLIYTQSAATWRFRDCDGEAVLVDLPGSSMQSNNGWMLRELAVAGMGITMAPDFILESAVAEGRLTEILATWQGAPLTIYAAYASRKHLSAKVRSFAAFFQDWLAERCPHAAALRGFVNE